MEHQSRTGNDRSFLGTNEFAKNDTIVPKSNYPILKMCFWKYWNKIVNVKNQKIYDDILKEKQIIMKLFSLYMSETLSMRPFFMFSMSTSILINLIEPDSSRDLLNNWSSLNWSNQTDHEIY